MSLGDLTSKKIITKTFHDNGVFTTRGQSKMMLEEKWLSKKEEQGYQFKRVAEEAKREEEKAEKIK